MPALPGSYFLNVNLLKSRQDACAPRFLFFEQIVEGRARIDRGSFCSARTQFIRGEKVAEVSLLSVGYPFSLRLAALVV